MILRRLRVSWVFLVCGLLGLAGCGLFLSGCARHRAAGTSEHAARTEAERVVDDLVRRTFVVSGGDYLAAREYSPKNVHLIQFHNPKFTLLDGRVSDTDRMNGITERHSLILSFTQYREWNGRWSLWKDGSPPPSRLLAALVQPIGFWSIRLSKVNGQWRMDNMVPTTNLVPDVRLVRSLCERAGVGS